MDNKVLKGEKQFTASVWILTRSTRPAKGGTRSGRGSKEPRKMLLHFHKKLERWLQFGGHIEKFENPVEAAVRETLEETGFDISFLLYEIKIVNEDGSFLPVPKFLMEQTIPAYQDQPEHFHIDSQYVVEVEEFQPKSEHEDGQIGWFSKDEILKLPIHEDTRIVVNKLM